MSTTEEKMMTRAEFAAAIDQREAEMKRVYDAMAELQQRHIALSKEFHTFWSTHLSGPFAEDADERTSDPNQQTAYIQTQTKESV
jgi:ABC-type ATPase with predicted acetyltransferase domain